LESSRKERTERRKKIKGGNLGIDNFGDLFVSGRRLK
jgi:hypothetical protein